MATNILTKMRTVKKSTKLLITNAGNIDVHYGAYSHDVMAAILVYNVPSHPTGN